jgi:hypothetical protein
MLSTMLMESVSLTCVLSWLSFDLQHFEEFNMSYFKTYMSQLECTVCHAVLLDTPNVSRRLLSWRTLSVDEI